jgi:hypothetical protein
MEDKKGPGPKKKVVIRKSTENREEPISPERIYGEAKLNYSDAEMAERRKGASGELSGTGLKYASIGKKLTPLTPEEHKEATRNLEKVKPEEASYYVDKTLEYKGGVPTASAMTVIDRISKVADEFKPTSPADIKELFEGDYGKKMLERSGLNEESFKALTKQGSDEGKKNLYYSILQRVNEKRKDLGPLTAKQSSFIVDMPEAVKTPESEKVVENKPDSAFKLVKDDKGVVRKVKK